MAPAERSGASGVGVADPAGGPLDLHKALCTGGCPRWPENLRLQSQLGDLIPGRCKGTNICEYCGVLRALENSEVLTLDALYGPAPVVWAVLTTPRADHDQASFYVAQKALRRALRARWPEYEAAALLEFTTGYGTNSGGLRRPHWNLLMKGVDVDDVDQVHDVIAAEWCPRVGGSADAQHVGTIYSAGGLMRYVAQHFQKQSQAPPQGWLGQRFNVTREYLWTSMPDARAAARGALALKRALWRAQEQGLTGQAAEDAAQAELAERAALGWKLVRLQDVPIAFGEDGLPCDWETMAIPVR